MTLRFLKETGERALKTFAQALTAILIAAGVDLISAPWLAALSAAGMAAVLSVLSSVASAQFGDEATPSLVRVDDDDEGGRHS